MAAHGARRLLPMAENAARVVGIELLAAAQGCDFHAPLRSSAPLEARPRAAAPARAAARRRPPSRAATSSAATALVRSGALAQAAGTDVLPARRGRPQREQPDDRRVLAHRRARRRRRSSSACRMPARTSRRTSSRASSRRGARARMPTGGSTGSTTSPPTSARRSCARRSRAPSSTSTAIPRAPRSIPARRRPSSARPTTFDGEPLYEPGGEPNPGEIAERRAALLRSLSRGAGAARSSACAPGTARWSCTTATRSARVIPRLFDGVLPDFNIGTNSRRELRARAARPPSRTSARGTDVQPRHRRPLQGRLDHAQPTASPTRASTPSRWSSPAAATCASRPVPSRTGCGRRPTTRPMPRRCALRSTRILDACLSFAADTRSRTTTA